MVGRHEAGLNLLIEAARIALGHADQADAVAERLGFADIGGDQVPDSRRRDRIDVELRPEAERGEDRQLVRRVDARSEEHTSELQSLMRISYAVFCLKKK